MCCPVMRGVQVAPSFRVQYRSPSIVAYVLVYSPWLVMTMLPIGLEVGASPRCSQLLP